jgi:hypothetical protein
MLGPPTSYPVGSLRGFVSLLDPEMEEYFARCLRGQSQVSVGFMWELLLEYLRNRPLITEGELRARRAIFSERLAAFQLARGALVERRPVELDASPPVAGRMRVGSLSRESSSLSDRVGEEGRGFLGTHVL